MRQQGFPGQCTAKSKRSNDRCRNFAVRDCHVCRMHGANSRRGSNHPNFRHGRRTKTVDFAHLFAPYAVQLRVYLFPKTASEMEMHKLSAKAIEAHVLDLDRLMPDDEIRILRVLRRAFAKELSLAREKYGP